MSTLFLVWFTITSSFWGHFHRPGLPRKLFSSLPAIGPQRWFGITCADNVSCSYPCARATGWMEHILDTPFAPEEVSTAVRLLKSGSSAGPDLLSPRHLLHAGPMMCVWLCKIFNAIANLEAIPLLFKEGILIPIYKGKGKDPLVPASYRGITLTSVIAKSFEVLLLDRMLPILIDRNIPQLTQRAYQRGVSCADATFMCQETISKFILFLRSGLRF